MAELYDEDIVLWSERHANALRRRAANEIDWDNVAGEIEDVGRSGINVTLSQIDNILRHRLYLLGWPNSPSVRKWQVELREFHRQLRRYLTPSMTGGQEPKSVGWRPGTAATPGPAAGDLVLLTDERLVGEPDSGPSGNPIMNPGQKDLYKRYKDVLKRYRKVV